MSTLRVLGRGHVAEVAAGAVCRLPLQVSLTAGTVLNGTRTALHLRFWSAYSMSTGTPGISAVSGSTSSGSSATRPQG